MPTNDVRANMVKGAARLLATRGVEGTSFTEVLETANAPRGSIYHHFPGGKSELLHAALDLVSTRGLEAMEEVRGQTAAAVVGRFLGLWRQLLDATKLDGGCAVVAVTVAEPETSLLDHAGTIFRSWSDQLTELLTVGGLAEPTARQFAVLLIAATEGAVVMCRAERNRQPFDITAAYLSNRVNSEASARHRL